MSTTGEVARCGLYCGQCRSFRKGRCPGCAANAKASWCAVRTCCGERGHATCADCTEFADPRACTRFNNWMSRTVGFLLNSNRAACIERIRADGVEKYAAFMELHHIVTIPRRGPAPS